MRRVDANPRIVGFLAVLVLTALLIVSYYWPGGDLRSAGVGKRALEGGAIAGIVIAVIVLVVGLAIGIFYFYHYRRKIAYNIEESEYSQVGSDERLHIDNMDNLVDLKRQSSSPSVTAKTPLYEPLLNNDADSDDDIPKPFEGKTRLTSQLSLSAPTPYSPPASNPASTHEPESTLPDTVETSKRDSHLGMANREESTFFLERTQSRSRTAAVSGGRDSITKSWSTT